jgi:hypothetical protein
VLDDATKMKRLEKQVLDLNKENEQMKVEEVSLRVWTCFRNIL